MKQITKTKILRKVLVLAFLVVGLIVVESNTTSYVSATPTCEEAYLSYVNADNAYYVARVSYFNGLPTTCAEDCDPITDPTAKQQCIDNCQITRHTALADAELDLFELAGGTCTPETVEQCDLARERADTCSSLYQYYNYSDPEEMDAVYNQFTACMTASGINSCM